MRVLGIIPARAGSKRVPRKNLRMLQGKSLVARSIEACLAATTLTRVVVSSDDDEALRIATDYDPRLPLRRPAELCTDTSMAIEFVRHALDTLEGSGGEERFEAVAIVQPSSPFTMADDIDGVLRLLKESGAESAVSVVEVEHALHPLKLKTMQGDRLLPYLEEEHGRMASHDLSKVFVRNCSVYSSLRKVHDDGRILSDDCRGYVMPRERSLDINDETDFAFAEFLLRRNASQS